MDRLNRPDVQALLDFVQDCYAFCEFDSFDHFLHNLVNSLSRLIPATHVTYNEMHPEASESHNWANTQELGTPLAAALWEQHMNEHPPLCHVLGTDDRRAARISDFWGDGEFHDRGLYCDFYRRYETEDVLCITIPCAPPRIIGIGWHRDTLFTDREVLIAEMARPHISQAWQNAKLVDAMRAQLRLLDQGLDGGPGGAIACDPEGHVHFMTGSARRYLLDYFDATASRDHRLPPRLLRWVRHQETLPQAGDVPPVRLPLTIERGAKKLTVRLLSKRGERSGGSVGEDGGARLILLEEEPQTPGNEEASSPLPPAQAAGALERFGLSPREGEVLTWVAQGKTNSEIATILGSKIGTVRKHVEHIFQKLGVETRTAAAMIIQNPRNES